MKIRFVRRRVLFVVRFRFEELDIHLFRAMSSLIHRRTQTLFKLLFALITCFVLHHHVTSFGVLSLCNNVCWSQSPNENLAVARSIELAEQQQ